MCSAVWPVPRGGGERRRLLTPRVRGTRLACGLLGLFALAGGAVCLSGWILDSPRLAGWGGSAIFMQPNAAVAALSAGMALVLLSLERRRLAVLPGFVTGLIGGATLFEHATGFALGIDEALTLGRSWGRAATVTTGRMGLPGSISWTLAGAALVLSAGRAGARRLVPAFGLLISAIAWLSLTGYLLGADTLYALPRATAIALQTALILFCVGVALVFSAPDTEPMRTFRSRTAAGIFARRALPVLIVLTALSGYIRLRGELAGLYDTAMGVALFALILTVVLCTTIWWAVRAVGSHERAVRESRAALQQSESRVAAMLETIADAFVSFDAAWRFTYVNGAAERMLHKDRSDLIGQVIWDLFPGWVGRPVHTALLKAAAGRVPVDGEDHDPVTGRIFWNRAYPTADGGVSVHFRDITDRKEAEAALREADRRKDEFLATLAHELRNPLAPVRNSLELIRRLKDRPERTGPALEMIDRQVKIMVRLIDDLLDVSRITRNRLELRREPVELASIVRHAVEACRLLYESSGHQLAVDLPADPIRLHADPTRLSQVLGNLLHNACKYTDPGGLIRLSVTREDGEAVIRVTDSGVGIPPGMLSRVFDLFMQVDGATDRRADGLGIGLSLVKRLVELHGGSVSAHSAGRGLGSEFTVRLPIGAGANEEATRPADGLVATAARPRRVLVVDDNRDAAESLSLLLGAAGHVAEMAHDGEQALGKAASFRPDAILLDIGLPGMNGYDTCRMIRAQAWGRGVLVVAVTGWGQQEDRLRSSEAGFDAHLVKPVDPAALMGILGDVPLERTAR